MPPAIRPNRSFCPLTTTDHSPRRFGSATSSTCLRATNAIAGLTRAAKPQGSSSFWRNASCMAQSLNVARIDGNSGSTGLVPAGRGGDGGLPWRTTSSVAVLLATASSCVSTESSPVSASAGAYCLKIELLIANRFGIPNSGGAAASRYELNDEIVSPCWSVTRQIFAATSSAVASEGESAWTQFHSLRSRAPSGDNLTSLIPTGLPFAAS